MKQETLIKILFVVTALAVLTGILLVFLKSSLPVAVLMIASLMYTLVIAVIIALDNKYLLNKVSGLWITNLQVPKPEFDSNLIAFTNVLSEFNQEVQKNLEETSKIALQLDDIKHKVQAKFVGSISTRKYHDRSCRFARQIKESNKINFKFERDAKKQGFNACRCLN